MRHASLFSGIGGAEIAAAWLGWENLFHCDINEFGRKVLRYWFPESKEYNDIKTTDFTEWRGKVDILTAGFPCQPFSLAGKRRGADDDRFLWPETIRVIKEVRPTWFVGENVFGIASMVLPGEEVDMGRTDDIFEEGNLYRTEQRYILDRICQGIEDAGYSVQPCVIPACAVGAPHRRDRVWFVARREDVGHDAEDTDRHGRGDRVAEERAEERGQRVSGAGDSGRLRGDFADPDSDGFHRGDGKDEVIADERRVDALGDACEGGPIQIPRFQGWEGFPTQPPVCRGDDGLPFRMADLAVPFGKWRKEAIKALGNAWVPEVAYEIFRMIQMVEYED